MPAITVRALTGISNDFFQPSPYLSSIAVFPIREHNLYHSMLLAAAQSFDRWRDN